MSAYFLRSAGRVVGPFPLDRLRRMALSGQIQAFHELSPDRVTWVSAGSVPELFQPAGAGPPPAPPPQAPARFAAADEPDLTLATYRRPSGLAPYVVMAVLAALLTGAGIAYWASADRKPPSKPDSAKSAASREEEEEPTRPRKTVPVPVFLPPAAPAPESRARREVESQLAEARSEEAAAERELADLNPLIAVADGAYQTAQRAADAADSAGDRLALLIAAKTAEAKRDDLIDQRKKQSHKLDLSRARLSQLEQELGRLPR